MRCFTPQQYGGSGHETFRIPVGRQQPQNGLFKIRYWHLWAASRKPGRPPSARNRSQMQGISSSVIRASRRMNQKQREWNRSNACCASASFSVVACGAVTVDGSFITDPKTNAES